MKFLASFKLIGTTIALLLISSGTTHAAPQRGNGPKPVVGTMKVTERDANIPEKYIGHVEAVESIDLKARVSGYLEQVNFSEGSTVKKGQVLYVIEQAPYKAQVAAAKASLAAAEADLFKARTKLNRMRSAEAGSIPQTDMDDATAAYDLAQARVLEAQARQQIAEIDLGYTTIKSPLTGRIGKSYFKRGDLISSSSGSLLAEVVSIDPMRVLFSINERQGEIIRQAAQDAANKGEAPGLKIRIFTTSGSEYPHTGRVEFMDNKMDPSTGTIAIWAQFPNPEGHLVPGEYVDVALRPEEPRMELTIPQAALQRDRDGAFVFVVDKDSKIEKRRISVGVSIGKQIFVTSGLELGEQVVFEGIQKVTPGAEVDVQLKEDKDNSYVF
ncbi:efflux RND transporter periplasmic adaptor subunit [Geoalkalibacter subterraneus]|uniref:efflux RND transporter periplasmic adaptor subunit n=1 Tax=Geoalkalibacter subterraneus TaxID=483547 RepID=UPI0006937486|nr:efflux RND transporter periplasmic adaptor subunit [Geoalkalibacter subterraneus]